MKINNTCPACKSENIGFVRFDDIISNSCQWRFVCYDCGRATKICKTSTEAWAEWERRTE